MGGSSPAWACGVCCLLADSGRLGASALVGSSVYSCGMWKWVKRAMVVVMLLLSSAIAVLWARSYYVTESYRYVRFMSNDRVGRTWEVGIWKGDVFFQDFRDRWTGRVWGAPGEPGEFYHVGYDPIPEPRPFMWNWSDSTSWRCGGFEWRSFSGGANSGDVGLVVPFWFLLLVTSLYPAIVGFRYMWRRRREGRGFPVEVSEGQAGGCGHSGLR